MLTDGLIASEKECAEGRTAPRVTLDSMVAKVEDSVYWRPPGTTLTIAVLRMQNGFYVLGESACASPENFDAELGQKLAYEDAIRKLWRLEGYALRDRLAAEKE